MSELTAASGSTILKGKDRLGIRKVMALSGNKDAYGTYLDTFKDRRANELTKYNELIGLDDFVSQGYVYPSNEIYNFDTEYFGDLIVAQEIILRKHIVQSLGSPRFKQLHLTELLPSHAKTVVNAGFCTVIRYHRLFELFYRACRVELTPEKVTQELKEISKNGTWEQAGREFGLPSIAQLDTMIKYSMDTFLCLNLILGLNGFKIFGPQGGAGELVELPVGSKVRFARKNPTGPSQIENPDSNTIKLGYSDKNGEILLYTNGEIRDIAGTLYDIKGIKTSKRTFDKDAIDATFIEEANVDNSDTSASMFSSSSIPSEGIWNLLWTKKDQTLHEELGFKTTPASVVVAEEDKSRTRKIIEGTSGVISKGLSYIPKFSRSRTQKLGGKRRTYNTNMKTKRRR